MRLLSTETQRLFVTAGWKPVAEVPLVRQTAPAAERAEEILRCFGGSHLKNFFPEEEDEEPWRDIHFYSSAWPEFGSAALLWRRQVGTCAGFGTALNEQCHLLINDEGKCFAFVPLYGHLYHLGESFDAAMQQLMFGFSMGAAIRRDV